MHRMRLVLSTTLILLASRGIGHADTIAISSLLLEGEAVPGVGNVTLINNLAVNDAAVWLVECDTDFPNTNLDEVMVRNGAAYIREGQLLPGPDADSLGSFDAVNLNNAGRSGWNFFLTGTAGTNFDSGIFYDSLIVIQESDISTAPQFSANTRYIGFFESRINDANQILVVASVDDPAIPSTVDRALVTLNLDGAGGLLSETVLLKEADFIPGETDSITDFGTGPHEFAFNDNGDVLYFADLTGATTTDGTIGLNTTILAQEGSLSPVAGRNYETLSGRGMDLNNLGGYVFKANLDGATTDDEMIVKNGASFIREGDNLPSIGAFTFTAFGLASGPVQIDDDGHVWWFGDWNDPDTNVDTGIFRDGVLLVKEGVTTVDGVVIDEIANGTDAFQVSDNGEYFIFEGTLVGGIVGAFLIQVTETPTAVTGLVSLDALPREAGVEILWEVRSRDDYLGFNVLRSADGGEFSRLNSEMIPNAADAFPAMMSWVDETSRSGVLYSYRIEVVYPDGTPEVWDNTVTGRRPGPAPLAFALRIAGPNPFRAGQGTAFQYSVPAPGAALSIAVYDVSGRRVANLVEGRVEAGVRAGEWRGDGPENLASGVYFLRMQADGFQATERIVLMR